MKFDISVKNESGIFTKVGFAKPSKSGKAWQLTLFTDRMDKIQRSPCGKFCNAIMVEDKRPNVSKEG